ncbi:MAG: A/G-specific adenine glycosylase [Elusimicrobia bacterium]|nr:A/G-specific adenine glycosylase [Elusimicrobiota bacterium]
MERGCRRVRLWDAIEPSEGDLRYHEAAARPLRRKLLGWYRLRRRRLPWRERPSPYRTWVSEIMLQQTQVSTVLPYYARFLRRFPDVRALADAPGEEVLRFWAGLGYYSRARNLHRAARIVARERGGRFPDSLGEALALPGIGRYTAGAILSIAFGKPFPVLDGNVARALSRLFAVRGNARTGPVRKRLWTLAERLLDKKRPGDWNQALMELGALLCVPESPRCGNCPVSAHCAAFKRNLQDRLPETGPKRAPVPLAWTCLRIEKDGKVLLHKRPESERFLPGHWGLPEARHAGRNGIPGETLGTVRHGITHHKIAMEVRRASPPREGLPPNCRWVRKRELGRYLVSSLWLKAARLVP